MNLSKYFTWEEVTRSPTADRLGIDNSFPLVLDTNIKHTAAKMDALRVILGTPVIVDSWYRCPALNSALKSKPTSEHLLGQAVDFISPDFGTPLEICQYLLHYEDNLNWNQLIYEHTWVHISFPSMDSVLGKREVLTLMPDGSYALGLKSKGA